MIFHQSFSGPRPNAGYIIPGRRFVDIGLETRAVGMAGRYKLVKHVRGIVLQETPWFDNIILDQGLNRWGTGAVIVGAAIGTGTSTPLATDTGLQTQTLFTSTSGTGDNTLTIGTAPNYNNTRTHVYRTPLGGLNGNYSEVGVGWASGPNMFSRALILDGGGAPTTISVLSTEQLDIYYQLSVYPPIVDWTGNVTIAGVSYAVTGRAAGVSSQSYWAVNTSSGIFQAGGFGYGGVYNGSIGVITGTPGGSGAASAGVTNDPYSNNSLLRTATQNAGLTDWNIGGITASLVQWINNNPLAAFQYGFSPAIPKDGTKTISMSYSISWARRS